MPTDLVAVSQMGKILDNSKPEIEPLTIFNTQAFGIFEYQERLAKFNQLKIHDEENFSDRMPKHFKTAYLGNEN